MSADVLVADQDPPVEGSETALEIIDHWLEVTRFCNSLGSDTVQNILLDIRNSLGDN